MAEINLTKTLQAFNESQIQTFSNTPIIDYIRKYCVDFNSFLVKNYYAMTYLVIAYVFLVFLTEYVDKKWYTVYIPDIGAIPGSDVNLVNLAKQLLLPIIFIRIVIIVLALEFGVTYIG